MCTRFRCPILSVVLLLQLSLGAASHAESSFVLDSPPDFETLEGASFGEDGARNGSARVGVTPMTEGRVRLESFSKLDTGAQMHALADLSPVAGGNYRVSFQTTESRTSDGRSLGLLEIDHLAKRARCTDRETNKTTELVLAPRDRVMNVPMHLFFLPLVRGERETLEFEILLCRPEPKLYAFKAWVQSGGSKGVQEVRYAPDLGMISILAQPMVPRLAFWFDQRSPHRWLAYRVPLYRGGPEITVVRDGTPHVSIGR